MGDVVEHLVEPLSRWFGASTNEPSDEQIEDLKKAFSKYSDDQLKQAAFHAMKVWEYRNLFPPIRLIQDGLRGTAENTFGNVKIVRDTKQWHLWRAFYDRAYNNQLISDKDHWHFIDAPFSIVPVPSPPKNWKTYQNWLDQREKDQE